MDKANYSEIKEMLDPNFKNLFLQEMPSVSIIMNLMPTQSRPLAVITSLICANVS